MNPGEKIVLTRDDSRVEGTIEEIGPNGVYLTHFGYLDLSVWTVAEPDFGAQLAEGLAKYMDGMAHLREAGSGFRKQLLDDGWSETVAEQIAAGMLAQMIAAAFGGRS